MSFFASLINKITYQANKAVSDPEADAYAAAQAKQAEQDAAVAANKVEKDLQKAAKEKADKEAKDAAEKLSARSNSSIAGFAGGSSQQILIVVCILIYITVALYGGHLAANRDIGYSPAGRIVSFIYGTILFPVLIIKYMWDTFKEGKEIKNYSFLPISTYVPTGDFEKLVLGPFCYVPDQSSVDATAKVAQEYLEAFQRTATSAAPPIDKTPPVAKPPVSSTV
jgi:FtsZ-interacting cell division protein YlmF